MRDITDPSEAQESPRESFTTPRLEERFASQGVGFRGPKLLETPKMSWNVVRDGDLDMTCSSRAQEVMR